MIDRCLVLSLLLALRPLAAADAPLPEGVRAVWDLKAAWREATPTRERVCLNGLWRWQPAQAVTDPVPADRWGWFKVPGGWPGISDWLQKDCQTVHAHPAWPETNLGAVKRAWYQRELQVPADWAGRRVALAVEYLNSLATVFLDGRRLGELRFPGGELELTGVRPGARQTLSLLVEAMPLKAVMLSFGDTASARQVPGTVRRRGLCGDVFLVSEPRGPRLGDVKIDPSVRRWELTCDVAVADLADGRYTLRAEVSDGERRVETFTSPAFGPAEVRDGRFSFIRPWRPEKLWDTHTPGNVYQVQMSLLDAGGRAVDVYRPLRFGFRELWIDGRDFILNGTRLHLTAVPLDNGQVGAAWASYAGARESLLRLQSFGINFVYTHNYGCEPGSHLGFEEILRAADDVGMLVALSQPHFGHYDWKAPDADQTNGYAQHAEYYVRVAQNHPSVVAWSTSHNATGYGEDMNPDLMDGVQARREDWATGNVKLALRAEAIIKKLDPSRIVYHHSSGTLGAMHTVNFYPNFAPIQELSDWFETWATKSVKPMFLCEYGAPFTWDFAMYRGWYRGARAFGGATVPWDFCLAEWNAQFLGDPAYRISDEERENLRWEAKQFAAGGRWNRWDYPHQLGSWDFDERYPVMAAYLTANWRAFRTWGVSAISPWEYAVYWKPKPGLERGRRQELPTDWARLQRPGFSPDYLEYRYDRMDLAYERADWVPTPAAEAMVRNNRPLLAWLAGKPTAFTSRDHVFLPGETVDKQLIVINDSREPATADCAWSLNTAPPASGRQQVTVAVGDQARLPLRFALPAGLAPGAYALTATVRFGSGETQDDSFTVQVLPPPPTVVAPANLAVYDPLGETTALLRAREVPFRAVAAGDGLNDVEALVIGKSALTVDGPCPDLLRVRDGLKVLVFEQPSAVLEQRLGFRVNEYGLRQVFPRVAGHPALSGLTSDHLRDWRGSATLVPPRLEYEPSRRFSGPTVRWCGIESPRVWRCGNRGNVASVLIEKPARGDFLPLVEGGFSLQYSPLLEYREGRGMVLFCQVDVTGRSETEPAAERLVGNLLAYLASWRPPDRRGALYVGNDDGRRHLEAAGVTAGRYSGGPLSADQVLVVGPGGGRALAPHRQAVAQWLKAGGRLLAVELDQAEADAFLPAPVTLTVKEHVNAFFEPFAAGSPFAGAGPADVHQRAPRELPLVAGPGAVGDGVLGEAGGVVFCQLAPWRVTRSRGALPAFEVTDGDAAEGRRSALVTMGTVANAQLGRRVAAGAVGRTYTLAAAVKVLDGPMTARLEVERAGRPWDRAARGEDVALKPGAWTELHLTFRVAKEFGEGWQAYVSASGEGGRFRADLLRLYEGDYRADQRGSNAADNESFEAGTAPYFCQFGSEQQNLRKTWRRASFLLTRVLANLGVAGVTPLLERFGQAVGGDGGTSLVRNGTFASDADGDGVADEWTFAATPRGTTCTREKLPDGGFAQLLAGAGPEAASVMLSQSGVPATQGQWYRLSLLARAEGLTARTVSVALQTTDKWQPLFDYQTFAPGPQWQRFAFTAPAKGTADKATRFQIWYQGTGKLSLAEVRFEPIADPTAGRWLDGLYLDQPAEWDDPYRFFRW